jgi:lipase chaperone LimK
VGVAAVRHAADERVLVGLLREHRQQFADLDAADIGRDGLFERAGVVGAGVGFRVEGVDVARAAPEPDLDDGFRLGL